MEGERETGREGGVEGERETGRGGVGKAPVAEMFVTLHKIIGEESARLWQRQG